jgi:hypothetical protein
MGNDETILFLRSREQNTRISHQKRAPQDGKKTPLSGAFFIC